MIEPKWMDRMCARTLDVFFERYSQWGHLNLGNWPHSYLRCFCKLFFRLKTLLQFGQGNLTLWTCCPAKDVEASRSSTKASKVSDSSANRRNKLQRSRLMYLERYTDEWTVDLSIDRKTSDLTKRNIKRGNNVESDSSNELSNRCTPTSIGHDTSTLCVHVFLYVIEIVIMIDDYTRQVIHRILTTTYTGHNKFRTLYIWESYSYNSAAKPFRFHILVAW